MQTVFKSESAPVATKLKLLSVGDNQSKNARDLEVRVKGLTISKKTLDWLLSNHSRVLRLAVKSAGKRNLTLNEHKTPFLYDSPSFCLEHI